MGFNNIYKLIFNFEAEPICQLSQKNQPACLKNMYLFQKCFFMILILGLDLTKE
jgi:hypothetical protein